MTLTGNERKDFHQAYHSLPNSSQVKFLESFLEFNNDNVKSTGVQTSDLNNREIPVNISGNIELATMPCMLLAATSMLTSISFRKHWSNTCPMRNAAAATTLIMC